MNRTATKNLKFDRRLIDRRGWVSKTELAKQLEALPDVSDKIAPPEDEGEEDAAPEAPGVE